MSTATPQAIGPVVLATHSSRHTPVCKDCTHYYGQKERCNHPSTAIDVLSGLPVMSIYAMRATHSTVSTHDAPVRCGIAGTLFEPAPEHLRRPAAAQPANPLACGNAHPRGDGPHDYTGLTGADC